MTESTNSQSSSNGKAKASPAWSQADLTPLKAAGLRLDGAILRLELAGAFRTLSAAELNEVGEEFLSAQEEYRTLLANLTGSDPHAIARRLLR